MANFEDFLEELRITTADRERTYVAKPKAMAPKGPQAIVKVAVKSVGDLDELVACDQSGHEFVISEPTYVGGRNIAPWPLEYLLGGAIGCFAAVFAFNAAKLGVKYDAFEAIARTEFDVRGHMIPNSPSSAFQNVTIEIHVTSNEPINRLREVEALAMAGCPGINTLRDPVSITSRLVVKSL